MFLCDAQAAMHSTASLSRSELGRKHERNQVTSAVHRSCKLKRLKWESGTAATYLGTTVAGNICVCLLHTLEAAHWPILL